MNDRCHAPAGPQGMLAAVLAVLASCGSTPTGPDDPPHTPSSVPLAIVGVRVVAMHSPAIHPDQTVLIRNGRIEWVGPSAERTPPADATVIQGDGRFLMPALVDMHVHVRASELDDYVDAGIATVRNLWGFPNLTQWTAEIQEGTRLGPTIVSASQGLDGSPPQWPFTVLVNEAGGARAAVQGQRSAGWPWLKVYSRLSADAFDSIIVAARELGIVPIGHVPFAVDVRHALASGMASIEHLTGYDRVVSAGGRAGTWAWADADISRFQELVDLTVTAGTWNCPTLTIFSELSRQHTAAEREAILRNRRLFVKRLFDAGAPLLVGTDAGIDVVPAGTAIHDELAEFVAAGLTPYQTLRAATVEAARFLERSDLGLIGAGAEASLLLLRGNPLEDVGHLRRLDGVVIRGSWRPAP